MFTSKSNVKEAKLEAVIIRANGTRENMGVISYYSKNPFKRLLFKIKKGWCKLWRQML